MRAGARDMELEPRSPDVVESARVRVVGYIRVSTEGQADGGVSLPAQVARLTAYALAMDLDLVEIVSDRGVSARTLERPGLARALGMLDAGEAGALLVTKLDRLTRSVRDLGELVERYFKSRFSLLSVSDSIDTRTAAGRLVLNVLVSIAQWEREAGSERTREVLAQVRTEVPLGGEALGWRRVAGDDVDARRLVVAVPEELDTVRRIRELRAQRFSMRQIAAILHDEGHPTKRGGTWAGATVRKVLLRAPSTS